MHAWGVSHTYKRHASADETDGAGCLPGLRVGWEPKPGYPTREGEYGRRSCTKVWRCVVLGG
jgi:hypothetical protein